MISRKKRRKRPEGRGWKSGKRREEEEEEREKERARGREKRYRRQEPVSPYFRFSSFREHSERLGDALSRLISISFVNGMFFFGSCLLYVDFGAHEWQTIVDTSSWRIS